MAERLESDLTAKFSSALVVQDLEEVANIFLEAYPWVLGLTSRFVPNEALEELRQKYDCNFPDGSGTYHGEQDHKTKDAIRKERYSLEADLLKAKHPHRIARLWDEAKTILKEMYHKNFSDRMAVAIMNSHYLARNNLISRAKSVRKAACYLHLVQSQLELGSPWDRIAEIWRTHYIEPSLHASAENMLSLLGELKQDSVKIRRGIKKLQREKDEDHEDDPSWYSAFDLSELSAAGVHAELPRHVNKDNVYWHDFYGPYELRYITGLILDDSAGPISFRQAFNLYDSRTAMVLGFKSHDGECCFGDKFPYVLSDIVMRGLKNAYDNRKPGDEIFTFLDWFIPIALERWKATAPDYQKVFRWHEAEPNVRDFIAKFYTIKDGKNVQYFDERIILGRLPMLLTDLLADGLITKEQIDPPLEEHYLLPDEIVGGPHCRALDVAMRMLTQISPSTSMIDSSMRPRRLLPMPEGERQLPELRDDLSGLAGLLDTKKSYSVLYSGDTCVFIGQTYKLPGGETRFSEIYRFTKLREGVVPKDGATVKIAGHAVHVTKQRDSEIKDFAQKHIYDIDSDALPAKQFIVVTDQPVAEFAAKYFRDFFALALIHRSWLFGDVRIELDRLSDLSLEQLLIRYPVTNISAGLGETNRTHFKTFELEGKFCFSLEYDGLDQPELYFIGNTLVSFLKECGIGIYLEPDLDESGRAIQKMKMENRAFYHEHREEMTQILHGRGLLNVLAFVVGGQEKYDFKDFGIANHPCKSCGKPYFSGWIYPDGKQDFEGFRTRSLHDLAYHPETLSTKFDQIKRVYNFLMDAKESETVPAFVQYPEIMLGLRSFMHAYEQNVKWSSMSFSMYLDHQGSVDMYYEPEQIAEDPALQRMLAKEEKVHALEELSGIIERVAAKHLQQRYEELQGLQPRDYDPVPFPSPMSDVMHFWSRQVMLYTVYRTVTPELLPAPGECSVKELPGLIRVVWG
jgi:hypothetical protein